MTVSSNKYFAIITLFSLLSLNTSAFACEEPELQRTLQIIHETIQVGYEAAFTGNYQKAISEGVRLSRESQQLSPSCQDLIRRVADRLQRIYNPSRTTCYGGVCCDGAGCVGN